MGKKINEEIIYHRSLQILPVILSFNSFQSPLEKKRTNDAENCQLNSLSIRMDGVKSATA